VNVTVLSGSGPIAPTTKGNTLVVVQTSTGSGMFWPYIDSTETQIGVQVGLFKVFDGIPFFYAMAGPRNPADSATYAIVPLSEGLVGGVGVFYLDQIPDGISAIQFPYRGGPPATAPGFGLDAPFSAVVYELTPATLDVISHNFQEVDISSGSQITSGDITPGPDNGGTIVFLMMGVERHDGETFTFPWPVDSEATFALGGSTVDTFDFGHMDSVSSSQHVASITSGFHFGGGPLGGLLAAFKGIAFNES